MRNSGWGWRAQEKGKSVGLTSPLSVLLSLQGCEWVVSLVTSSFRHFSQNSKGARATRGRDIIFGVKLHGGQYWASGQYSTEFLSVPDTLWGNTALPHCPPYLSLFYSPFLPSMMKIGLEYITSLLSAWNLSDCRSLHEAATASNCIMVGHRLRRLQVVI